MLKKLGTGALAITLLLSIGGAPLFAGSATGNSLEQNQIGIPRQVVPVNSWFSKSGTAFIFTEGRNLVDNIQFSGSNLKFQFKSRGKVTVQLQRGSSFETFRYAVH
ncbi:hypothetical protein [Paenibacillus sp. 481]|uniref:hypothetical protein n=1 Tax=Paenibacillus sp. 481 TaxID=2835869 RepID=UPI001E3B8403|nr:hypothetical protein [Paenibacillus sp. 481]UHA72753.1 hypothetical protein KIK04_19290 [Paenibacillus sp. 481]